MKSASDVQPRSELDPCDAKTKIWHLCEGKTRIVRVGSALKNGLLGRRALAHDCLIVPQSEHDPKAFQFSRDSPEVDVGKGFDGHVDLHHTLRPPFDGTASE